MSISPKRKYSFPSRVALTLPAVPRQRPTHCLPSRPPFSTATTAFFEISSRRCIKRHEKVSELGPNPLSRRGFLLILSACASVTCELIFFSRSRRSVIGVAESWRDLSNNSSCESESTFFFVLFVLVTSSRLYSSSCEERTTY